jgi:threonine dehydrogenase-like Zn-dependent dehydrogenase
MAAREAGALTVILAGLTRDKRRLEIGLTLGADVVVDAEQEDLSERVMEVTRGRGVDVVVDTTGDPTGVVARTAVAVAAKGAYLNLNGLKQTVDVGMIKKKYLTVRAPRGHSYGAVDLALRMVASGRYPVESVCSHSFGLEDAARAIHATAGKEGPEAIHVTVDPWK